MAQNEQQQQQEQQQQSTAVSTTSTREFIDFLQSQNVRAEVEKALPPSAIRVETFLRIAATTIVGDEKLLQAARTKVGRASLMNAILRCAQIGLPPDGYHAHLIPYYDSKNESFLVQVIYDYKGLVALARRAGLDVKAVLVYEKDKFEYIEDDGQGRTIVTHEYNPFSDRGKLIGVYSRVREKGKDPDYECMSVDEIIQIRNRSQAYVRSKSGPWVTDFSEMAKKTVLRRHRKRWNLEPALAAAIDSDDDVVNETEPSQTVKRPLFTPVEVVKNQQSDQGDGVDKQPEQEIQGKFWTETDQQQQQQ